MSQARAVRRMGLVTLSASPRRRLGPHFICPECGGHDWKVIRTFFSEGRNAIGRRRECVDCLNRKTTWEVDDAPPRTR